MSQPLLTTFCYLNLAGVCPNSFDSDFISWTNKLYIGFLGIFPTYHFVYSLRDCYNSHQDIAAFLLVVGYLIHWINFLINIIVPALNPTLIVKFFQIIEEAQETITALGITHQPVYPSNKTQLWYIGGFGIIPIVSTVLVWSVNISFYQTFSILFTLEVNFAVLLKMKLMLLLLNGKFELLNNRLKKVSDESMSISSNTDFDVDSFLFKLHGIKYVKHRSTGSGITVDRILMFNKAHFQLCDAHKMLDSIFSLIALSDTLCVCFFIIIAFTTNVEDNLLGEIHLYFYSFLMLFLFISVLSSATDIQKTGYLVHELLNEELPFEVEEELQLFSQSLCLRKVGISAQGFFMIDLKLLTKIVCTLAPLILIVVQRKHRAKKAIQN